MMLDGRIMVIGCSIAVAVSLTTLAIGRFRDPDAAWFFVGGYLLGLGVMFAIAWLARRDPWV